MIVHVGRLGDTAPFGPGGSNVSHPAMIARAISLPSESFTASKASAAVPKIVRALPVAAPSPVIQPKAAAAVPLVAGQCPPEPARNPHNALLFLDPDAGKVYLDCVAAKLLAQEKAYFDSVVEHRAGGGGGCGRDPSDVYNSGSAYTGKPLRAAWDACRAALATAPVASSSAAPAAEGAGVTTYQVPASAPSTGAQMSQSGGGSTVYQVPPSELDVRGGGSVGAGEVEVGADAAPVQAMPAAPIPPVVLAAGAVAALGLGFLLVRRFL